MQCAGLCLSCVALVGFLHARFRIGSDFTFQLLGFPAGLPDTAAVGDAFDDGVVADSVVLTAGATTASVGVRAVNTTVNPATLAGWIDFDGNGTFEAGERAQVTVPAGTAAPTEFTLNWNGLAPIPGGFSGIARFRIATNPVEVNDPVGPAADGEVEDYVVPTLAVVRIAKALAGESGVEPGAAEPGEQLTYTITLTTAGGSDAIGYAVTDVLDPNVTFVSADNGGALVGGNVEWAGLTVPAGGSLTLTVVVQVVDPIPPGVVAIGNVAYDPTDRCPIAMPTRCRRTAPASPPIRASRC